MSELADSWYPKSQIRILLALFWRKERWILTFLDTVKHNVTDQVIKTARMSLKIKRLFTALPLPDGLTFFDYLTASFQLRIVDGVIYIYIHDESSAVYS
jgi:hypothetical protein